MRDTQPPPAIIELIPAALAFAIGRVQREELLHRVSVFRGRD